MYYARDTVEELKNSSQLVIYGAGLVAYEAAVCLTGEPYGLNIECFLVSDKNGNPDRLLGLPVIGLNEGENRIHKNALIIVAVMGKYLDEIRVYLEKKGFVHILPMTFESDLWSDIRGNYFMEYCQKNQKEYWKLEEVLERQIKEAENWDGNRGLTGDNRNQGVCIYTAKCHVDRELKEDLRRYSWEIPIRAGAGLTGERICEICDDTGEHISYKNRQYCELTSLYWIWKNDQSDYVGLSHYRRHFEVNEKDLETLADSDIDVVLTIPIFDVPSVERVYQRDHVEADWQVMMEGMKTLCPEYLKAARELSKGRFYYAYNMFLMRREILEKYCQWLFPLLFYCEERCSGRERDGYQGRYIGFLAEHLMSIYFLYHEKEYKVVHARKHFVEW